MTDLLYICFCYQNSYFKDQTVIITSSIAVVVSLLYHDSSAFMVNAITHDHVLVVLFRYFKLTCLYHRRVNNTYKTHQMETSFTDITELPVLIVLTLHTVSIFEITFNFFKLAPFRDQEWNES